jgi:hypothetical protein
MNQEDAELSGGPLSFSFPPRFTTSAIYDPGGPLRRRSFAPARHGDNVAHVHCGRKGSLKTMAGPERLRVSCKHHSTSRVAFWSPGGGERHASGRHVEFLRIFSGAGVDAGAYGLELGGERDAEEQRNRGQLSPNE